MNWETGYGDWIGREAWETTRVLPWSSRPPSCSATRSTRPARRSYLTPDDAEAPGRRAAAQGYTVKAGTEFEFYVLSDTFEDLSRRATRTSSGRLLQRGLSPPPATKLEPLYRQIRNQMTLARIPIEFSKGEAAPSQHEVNIRYDEVLESADRSSSSSTEPRRSPG